MRMNTDHLIGSSIKACANVEKVKIHYWKMAVSVLVENGCSPRPWKKKSGKNGTLLQARQGHTTGTAIKQVSL